VQPGDRLTSKEVQVATLVWQGLTSKDIAGVIGTSEQVVKNQESPAHDLRQAGRLDPAGTGPLRRFAWRRYLAYIAVNSHQLNPPAGEEDTASQTVILPRSASKSCRRYQGLLRQR